MRLSAKMPALRTLVADRDVARNNPDVTRHRPDVTRNRPHVTRDRPHVTLFFGDPFRILARASPCYAFLVPMLRFFVSMLRFCVPPLRLFFCCSMIRAASFKIPTFREERVRPQTRYACYAKLRVTSVTRSLWV